MTWLVVFYFDSHVFVLLLVLVLVLVLVLMLVLVLVHVMRAQVLCGAMAEEASRVYEQAMAVFKHWQEDQTVFYGDHLLPDKDLQYTSLAEIHRIVSGIAKSKYLAAKHSTTGSTREGIETHNEAHKESARNTAAAKGAGSEDRGGEEAAARNTMSDMHEEVARRQLFWDSSSEEEEPRVHSAENLRPKDTAKAAGADAEEEAMAEQERQQRDPKFLARKVVKLLSEDTSLGALRRAASNGVCWRRVGGVVCADRLSCTGRVSAGVM